MSVSRFPNQPEGAQHLFAVARVDHALVGSDAEAAFVLTRGYRTEDEANAHADHMNASGKQGSTSFVLPVRVPDAAHD